MPITVTTLNPESYDGLDILGEESDGDGLSLIEAIGLVNAQEATNPISFDASLAGMTLDLFTDLGSVFGDLVLDGDADGDGVIDITLRNTSADSPVFLELEAAGAVFESNVDIVVDLSASDQGRANIVNSRADNQSILNTGSISLLGGSSGLDLSVIIQANTDGLSVTNAAGASMVTTGRSVIQSQFFADASATSALGTSVVNHGLMEAADDTVRITSGSILNTGTIRTTGAFTFNPDVPGQSADAIAVFQFFPETFEFDPNGILALTNSETGVVEGFRSALSLSGGGVVDNAGIMTGRAAGILAQGHFTNDDAVSFTLDNTGTIARLGDFTGVFTDRDAAVVVSFGGGLESASITNSGTITSLDIAVSASGGGLVLSNSGMIISDDDGLGDDGIAFRGAVTEDFELTPFIAFLFAPDPDTVVSSQGITVDANGDLVIDGVAYAAPGGQIPALSGFSVDGLILLPLVDIAATQQSGTVVFETENGILQFPLPITIDTDTLGPVTLLEDTNGEIVVVDPDGNPILVIPETADFTDTITNTGDIDGDIHTGLGDDSVTNSGGINGDIHLGAGDDSFTATSGSITGDVHGGGGDDRLFGSDASDVLRGGDGDDLVYGGAAGDTLFGGEGIDLLRGDDGDDVLHGDGGNDTLSGGAGDDTLFGGDGNDRFTSDAGADAMYGGEGRDRVQYSTSDAGVTVNLIDQSQNTGDAVGDTFFSIEAVIGTDFRDVLVSGNEAQDLFGGAGNDSLLGAGGDDRLFGGDGNDLILGGRGDDVLRGDAGNDTFSVRANEGRDRILDFTQGEDTILFTGGPASIADLTITTNDVGTVVTSGIGAIVLVGFFDTLTEGDFRFRLPSQSSEPVDGDQDLTKEDLYVDLSGRMSLGMESVSVAEPHEVELEGMGWEAHDQGWDADAFA